MGDNTSIDIVLRTKANLVFVCLSAFLANLCDVAAKLYIVIHKAIKYKSRNCDNVYVETKQLRRITRLLICSKILQKKLWAFW